jgi:hypothetical protein
MAKLKEFSVDDFDNPQKVTGNGKENKDPKDSPGDFKLKGIETHTIIVMKTDEEERDSNDETNILCQWYWICVGGKYFKVCL